MFIIENNPNREMKILLRSIKQMLGHVPPHFELFATVNPTRFKMFMEEIAYLSKHEAINPDFFPFLRYYIASKNAFKYCYNFNGQLLQNKGYSSETLAQLEMSMQALPLDEKHIRLFEGVMLAIDTPELFTKEHLETLKTLGWTDADIYDAVDHGAFLFKFSKILKAYGSNPS